MEIFDLLLDGHNWEISDIFSLISIILVIIGGIFAYRQWMYANKTKRAEFIKQIMEKLRLDREMVNTMFLIEYDEKWYDIKFHNRKDDLEYQIDKLLSYLSYICYLKKEKHISNKEFNTLQYEINRVCRSRETQNYLWNLYHFSNFQGYECSFKYLIDYGIKNSLIDKCTFYNPKSDNYKDVLSIKKRAMLYTSRKSG